MPEWLETANDIAKNSVEQYLNTCENLYLSLLDQGATPQEARGVLPNMLKTELIMTGTVVQWNEFFNLRCDKAAHPQARELAKPLKEEFINLELIIK